MELNNRLLSTFKDLLNDIELLDNDIGSKSKKCYNNILELKQLDSIDNYENLSKFLCTLDRHSKKISDRDDKIINSINLIDIDIKELWEKIEDSDKNKIWKYLQTLCLIKLNIESNEELKTILSGKNDIDKSNKENLKTLKKIKLLKSGLEKTTEEIDKKEEEEEEEEEENTENINNNLNHILNNTGIGNLAKEIAEDFNFDGENSDDLMNPANLMNLFAKINTTVQDKIKSGNLDLGKVTSELPSLYSNMQQDPLFNHMSNMNQGNKEEKEENIKKEKEDIKVEDIENEDIENEDIENEDIENENTTEIKKKVIKNNKKKGSKKKKK